MSQFIRVKDSREKDVVGFHSGFFNELQGYIAKIGGGCKCRMSHYPKQWHMLLDHRRRKDLLRIMWLLQQSLLGK